MRHALIAIAFLAVFFHAASARSATDAAGPTERDWMVQLVDSLGWSFGLPDEPEDEDYLRILNGNRHFRIEAEAHHQSNDMVSVKKYRTFGSFSGEGWLSGIATPTAAHLRFLLPLPGTYEISASVRLAGHDLGIGGRRFEANGEQRFTVVRLGTIELPAGETEIDIRLPPNGGIDYLEFEAPPLGAVRPLTGWRPNDRLTRETMAVTAARAFELEALLPPSDTEKVIEAESAGHIEKARITDIRHLGIPSDGRWVRAGTGHGTIDLAFEPPAAGVYTLSLRAAGNGALAATLNRRFTLSRQYPPYLQTLELGAFFLPAGGNHLELHLPPRGGADSLILRGHRSQAADYLRLVGLPADGGAPTTTEVNDFLSLLAAIGTAR